MIFMTTIIIHHLDGLFRVGLLAQLVERCIGIAEVVGSNTVRAKKFFSGLISITSSVVFIAARISYIRFFTAVQMIFIYLQSLVPK